MQEGYHEQRSGEEGSRQALDGHREQIEGWLRQDYSFLVIHKLLQQRGVEYSETTVRRYIHRQFPTSVRPVMRRETIAGEVLEVDFGYLGLTWDAAVRARKRTWVFSGRLRHSRRAYRELALHYGFLISPCLPRRPFAPSARRSRRRRGHGRRPRRRLRRRTSPAASRCAPPGRP